jgi:hypothetical protein
MIYGKMFNILSIKIFVPCFKHKDWWWHTVICRANVGKYKMISPKFIDTEDHNKIFLFA